MKRYLNFAIFVGGGWSLVVSISGSDNNHILRTEHNCLNSSYCVPLATGKLTARKHSDSDIRALAAHEGMLLLSNVYRVMIKASLLYVYYNSIFLLFITVRIREQRAVEIY